MMSTSAEPHCWDDVIGPNERLVARGYRTHHELGVSPALLLIDCYRGVFGDHPEPLAKAMERFPATCGTAAWHALPALERLLASARDTRLPVVHTTGESRSQAGLGTTTRRHRPPAVDEAKRYEIVEPLVPLEGELIVRKSMASAFFGTMLSSWLRRLAVDTLVVGGETTSGCVRATVVDAYSHGFRVAVAEEATFDRSELSHKVNLFDMHLKYASVLHLGAAIDFIRGNGAH